MLQSQRAGYRNVFGFLEKLGEKMKNKTNILIVIIILILHGILVANEDKKLSENDLTTKERIMYEQIIF